MLSLSVRCATNGCSRKPPLTCDSGPKGIRTPDLLAASHTALNGVLTRENAGHCRANEAKLSPVAEALIYRLDALLSAHASGHAKTSHIRDHSA